MQHRYFAASNSANGFKNYFPEIFSRVDRLYVIKGGPGTGKSSFMKRCAACAEENGAPVEYYLCSSDPESLDGIIFTLDGKTVGLLDGTYPHVWEPKHPGAVEQIVNLGEFWNRDLLYDQKNEIIALGAKKSLAYNRAYGYLRSCGNIRAVTDSILRSVIDADKMKKAAVRLSDKLFDRREGGRIIPAVTDAVTMVGRVKLDSFISNAKEVFKIGYFFGAGQLFLVELLKDLQSRGLCLRVAYDAISPDLINGIFVEDSDIAFVVDDKTGIQSNDEKYINIKRFLIGDELARIRAELRYNEKLSKNALDLALTALSEVKIYHFLLEDIYKGAMDFDLLNEFCDDFVFRM